MKTVGKCCVEKQEKEKILAKLLSILKDRALIWPLSLQPEAGSHSLLTTGCLPSSAEGWKATWPNRSFHFPGSCCIQVSPQHSPWLELVLCFPLSFRLTALSALPLDSCFPLAGLFPPCALQPRMSWGCVKAKLL